MDLRPARTRRDGDGEFTTRHIGATWKALRDIGGMGILGQLHQKQQLLTLTRDASVSPMAHTETKRDLIIKEASRIMYERGTGVGVDTLVSEIGVAKMTLYKHFPTKTDLIVARASALRVLELP